MQTNDFEKYMDKKVHVICTDGQSIIGELDSVAPDYDTESGKDELEIFIEGVYLVIPIDEVEYIEIVQL